MSFEEVHKIHVDKKPKSNISPHYSAKYIFFNIIKICVIYILYETTCEM